MESEGPCVCSVTFRRLLSTGVQLQGVPEEMKMATQSSVAMKGDGKVIISKSENSNSATRIESPGPRVKLAYSLHLITVANCALLLFQFIPILKGPGN